MIMDNKKLTGEVAVFALLMVGCVTSTEVATPTAVNSVEPTATVTSATTPSPEPTSIPTLNPALPTPDFTQSRIADQYLLAPSDVDCQLPCWQGLRVGVSTRQDVLDTLNSLFEFGGYVDFFDDNVTNLDLLAEASLEIEGVEGGGYSWATQEQEANFSLLAAVDVERGVLRGLQFRHLTGLYSEQLPHRYQMRTLQQVVEELETPSAIYTTRRGSWLVGIMLLYEKGIVSVSIVEVQGKPSPGPTVTSRSAEFCLDDQPWTAVDSIIEPFESTRKDPVPSNPINERWIIQQYNPLELHPIEEALGLTTDEFVAIARSDHPCIEVDYESLPPTR